MDNDCHKFGVEEELRCPVKQSPVCFNNVCACDSNDPSKHVV